MKFLSLLSSMALLCLSLSAQINHPLGVTQHSSCGQAGPRMTFATSFYPGASVVPVIDSTQGADYFLILSPVSTGSMCGLGVDPSFYWSHSWTGAWVDFILPRDPAIVGLVLYSQAVIVSDTVKFTQVLRIQAVTSPLVW